MGQVLVSSFDGHLPVKAADKFEVLFEKSAYGFKELTLLGCKMFWIIVGVVR